MEKLYETFFRTGATKDVSEFLEWVLKEAGKERGVLESFLKEQAGKEEQHIDFLLMELLDMSGENLKAKLASIAKDTTLRNIVKDVVLSSKDHQEQLFALLKTKAPELFESIKADLEKEGLGNIADFGVSLDSWGMGDMGYLPGKKVKK